VYLLSISGGVSTTTTSGGALSTGGTPLTTTTTTTTTGTHYQYSLLLILTPVPSRRVSVRYWMGGEQVSGGVYPDPIPSSPALYSLRGTLYRTRASEERRMYPLWTTP
jgi:hypothetical protein